MWKARANFWTSVQLSELRLTMPTQHRGKSVVVTRNNVGLVNIRHFCPRQMVKPLYLSLPQDAASRILGLVSDGFRERSPCKLRLPCRREHAQNICRMQQWLHLGSQWSSNTRGQRCSFYAIDVIGIVLLPDVRDSASWADFGCEDPGSPSPFGLPGLQ